MLCSFNTILLILKYVLIFIACLFILIIFNLPFIHLIYWIKIIFCIFQLLFSLYLVLVWYLKSVDLALQHFAISIILAYLCLICCICIFLLSNSFVFLFIIMVLLLIWLVHDRFLTVKLIAAYGIYVKAVNMGLFYWTVFIKRLRLHIFYIVCLLALHYFCIFTWFVIILAWLISYCEFS